MSQRARLRKHQRRSQTATLATRRKWVELAHLRGNILSWNDCRMMESWQALTAILLIVQATAVVILIAKADEFFYGGLHQLD
jgi:hypothetical protein